MTETACHDQRALQKRLILSEPDAGWSRTAYDQEIVAYVTERGRPPQTVTMHPDTAAALGLSEALVDPSPRPDEPLVITSRADARGTITLYY